MTTTVACKAACGKTTPAWTRCCAGEAAAGAAVGPTATTPSVTTVAVPAATAASVAGRRVPRAECEKGDPQAGPAHRLLEPGKGLGEAAAHGADGDVEHLRDLAVGVAVQIGHGQDLAVLLRQLRQLSVNGVSLQGRDESAPRSVPARRSIDLVREQAPSSAVAPEATPRVDRESPGASNQPGPHQAGSHLRRTAIFHAVGPSRVEAGAQGPKTVHLLWISCSGYIR